MDDSTRARPEAKEEGEAQRDAQTCPCADRFPDLTPEHHEFLMAWEDRGLAGLVEIWTYLEADSDIQHTPGTLAWPEFEEFAARHCWGAEQQSAVYDLASLICNGIRYRHEANNRKKLLEAV